MSGMNWARQGHAGGSMASGRLGHPVGGQDSTPGGRWEQRHARRGSKGYVRSDERRKEDFSERMYANDDFDASEVTVEVLSGTVTSVASSSTGSKRGGE